MTATPVSYFPGESARIFLSDLTHITDGPITTGATVTFVITDLDGDVETGGGTAAATNDDWLLDFDTPSTPGQYRILATAVYSGKTGKWVLPFNVVAHQ